MVAWERRREALVIWLSGTLDRATRTGLTTELDARAIDPMSLVVDLTGLEFIDASGLDTLARIHRRRPNAVTGCPFGSGSTSPSGRSA